MYETVQMEGVSVSRIQDGNGRYAQGEDEVGKIWKQYFEDLNNIDNQKQVVLHICGFDGIWRENYFGGEPTGRAEVDVRVGKLKTGKAAIKGDGLDLEAM